LAEDRARRESETAMRYITILLIGLIVSPSWAEDIEFFINEPKELKSKTPPIEDDTGHWHETLAEGRRASLTHNKPIFVLFHLEACPACRRLEAELKNDAIQQELGRWTLVSIDVAEQAADATKLGVTVVPALRVLSRGGQMIAQRDGFVEADKLVAWLRSHHTEASVQPSDLLLRGGKLSTTEAIELVQQFGERDAAVREAAIRRLKPHPDVAKDLVVSVFRKGAVGTADGWNARGSLAHRLAALELLTAWEAPVDGIDPWQPKTLSNERIARLDEWLEKETPVKDPTNSAVDSAPDDLAAARIEIDRMLKADVDQARAIRERLAAQGDQLLPEVLKRLHGAATDRDRERLLTLRYRLVADDTLPLRWPGGLEQLAATSAEERQVAAESLIALATQADQRLLLELFSDPDPLIRELSLRGLEHVGGKQSKEALVRLLRDPDLNVRAAVLKQLAEDAPQAMLPQIAEYVKTEADTDLLVHAIRYLREAKGEIAVRALVPLLKHESWQVRAEAAEAIGETLSTSVGRSFETSLRADAFVSLIELLDDGDEFVVSRAVKGLRSVDTAAAVKPLIEAADKHPDLAPQILGLLVDDSDMLGKALPHLREFTTHESAKVRAASFAGLYQASPGTIEKDINAGLSDSDSLVRTTAAAALFQRMEGIRDDGQEQVFRGVTHGISADPFGGIPVMPPVRRASTFRSTIRSLFGGADWKEVELDVPEIDLKEPSIEAPAIQVPDPDAPAKVDAPATVRADPLPTEPNDVEATTDTKDGESAEPPEDDNVDPWDRWLAQCYTGAKLPDWMYETKPSLTEMLSAEDAKERLTAAMALVPLGEYPAALPVINAAVVADTELVLPAANILPWLPWDERKKMFDLLRASLNGSYGLYSLASKMAEIPNPRGADLFWGMLGDDTIEEDTAGYFYEVLQRFYYGERYYSPSDASPAIRKKVAAAAKQQAETGGKWQRLVGLVMLANAAPDQVTAVAKQLMSDAKLDEGLRRDAYHVYFTTLPKTERRELAVASLTGDDPHRKSIALRYFVAGLDDLEYVRGYRFDLELADDDVRQRQSSGQPIIPKPPKGIQADDVRPLINDEDPRTAAYAGHLLSLFRYSDGLPPLLKYWREQGTDDDDLNRMVYRSIAILDASDHIDVLEAIYGTMSSYRASEFYWTIRIMSGPKMLALRKRIRTEVGMDELRW
jgi:HEAT repeat protein/thiol-disulfide isomerase/thioredoxin